MFVALSVGSVMTQIQKDPSRWNNPYTCVVRKDLALDPANTYMLVFGFSQYGDLKAFEEQWKGPILFKSKRAVNKQPGHGTYPRNTLVVFELPQEGLLEAS